MRLRPISRIVPVRLNIETVKEFERQARQKGLRLGTHLRRLLQDYAPGRDTSELRSRNGRNKKLIS